MTSNRRLIQDAQAFIQSIEDFQTPDRAKRFSKQENSPEKPEKRESLPEKRSFSPEISFEKKPTSFWPKLVLKDFRREAITFIETFWTRYSKLPAISDFKLHFKSEPDLLPKTPKDWEDFLLSIQDSLTNRGIRPYETPTNYLEPNFVLAVNLVCNPHDRRSIPAKLKEAGLTTKQWTSFLRLDKHQEYYRTKLNYIFNEDTQDEAKAALMKLVQAGDLQAIKYYHELQNIYRPNNTNQIQIVLMAIMEILATHVEPALLGRVASELQASDVIRNAIPARAS